MRAAVLSVLAGVGLASSALADPVVLFQSRLGDHPDAAESPPPYGLRMDNLFGSGVTTFSFQQNDANVVIQVLDTNDDGNADEINIKGTVFGGKVDGAGGYAAGAGLYRLDFTFRNTVLTNPEGQDGWTADSVDGTQSGVTVSSSGTFGEVDGDRLWNFYQEYSPTFGGEGNGDRFAFLRDGHRLPGDSSSLVGRGWLTTNSDGTGIGRTQDFLFVTIPLPGSAGMALAGLGLVAVRRRRSA